MSQGKTERILVERGGERLDVFLTEYFKGEHTRSRIAVSVKNGKVTVNGAAVKAGAVLKVGDTIEACIEREESECVPEDMPIEVVFEDEYLMIVNKPRGVVVHPGAGNRSGTLLNGLLFRSGKGAADSANASDFDSRLVRGGIVHRLDKNTAGLLVVAKTASVQAKLSAMFEKREVRRVYLGLVEGVLKENRGTVETQIIRDPNRRTLFKAAESGGRHAVTRYRVIETLPNKTAEISGLGGSKGRWSLVQFELETGRTHQIRVHCKFLGHPIVGDAEYNPASSVKANGQLLESVELGFVHPVLGKNMEFSADMTAEMRKIVEKLR